MKQQSSFSKNGIVQVFYRRADDALHYKQSWILVLKHQELVFMSCRFECVDMKSRPELMGEPLGHIPNSIFLNLVC